MLTGQDYAVLLITQFFFGLGHKAALLGGKCITEF